MKSDNRCFLCHKDVNVACQNDSEENIQQPQQIDKVELEKPDESQLQILFDSVLKIGNCWTDSIPQLLNLCSTCSDDLTTVKRLTDELHRLEIVLKDLNEKLLNSSIQSLVFSSSGNQEEEEVPSLKHAVENLKKTPVQFNIYRRWRSRFVKMFHSKYPVQSEESDKVVETPVPDLITIPTTNLIPNSIEESNIIDLIHDHSYGISLKIQDLRHEGGNENSRGHTTKLIPEMKEIEGFYACTICDRRFRRLATWKEHAKKAHSKRCSSSSQGLPDLTDEEYDALCDDCKRNGITSGTECKECNLLKSKRRIQISKNKSSRKREAEESEDLDLNEKASSSLVLKQKESLSCNLCDKTYVKRRDLDRHIRTHTGERPFICQYCQKSFLDGRQLTVHERIHTGEKRYVCELCGSAFSSLSGFHSHRKTHARFRPISCEQCQGKFRSVGQLRKHQLIHSGEKPHACTICQKTFNRKENLRIHEYTHTTLKPHKCPHCPQSFIRSLPLRKHIKNFHSDPTESTLKDSAKPSNREQSVEIIPASHFGVVETSDSPNIELPPLQFQTISPEVINVVPEAIFITENGEQFLIFN